MSHPPAKDIAPIALFTAYLLYTPNTDLLLKRIQRCFTCTTSGSCPVSAHVANPHGARDILVCLPKLHTRGVSFRMTLVTLHTHKQAMSQEPREMKPSHCMIHYGNVHAEKQLGQ